MRNDEFFSNAPKIVDITRSRFDRSSNLHTSFNGGRLVPIYLSEILPADTCDMTLASSVRMSTPITPVMDDCYLDTYFFFIPSRLCWNRWEEFNGENVRGNWTSGIDENIRIPMCAFNKDSQRVFDTATSTYRLNEDTPQNDLEGTLVDYFGLPFLNMRDYRELPEDIENTDRFSLLPFEAYNLVWNEFFRDQNTQDPCPLKLQDTSMIDVEAVTGIYAETNESESAPALDIDYVGNINSDYFAVKHAGKLHDYFTSCLPQPQKHAPIALPGFPTDLEDGKSSLHVITGWNNSVAPGSPPLQFARNDTGTAWPMHENGLLRTNEFGQVMNTVNDDITMTGQMFVSPTNLYGVFDVSRVPNINDLRNAFALQNLFEVDAIGGSRYIESLYHHFGVLNPDARLQRPEYLGGERVVIGMEQVVQTSSTNEVSPQGNVSGLSLTNHIGSSFTKSFTEHGYLLGLAVVRPKHTYQNGINKMWSREHRFDFYYPELSNIGEQPVYYKEILAGLNHPEDIGVASTPSADKSFGYQEPWAEYRYDTNKITGKMRSLLPDSLDIWHYADVFNQVRLVDGGGHVTYIGDVPTLSDAFISETGVNIDRTLAIPQSIQPQFFADFRFECQFTRPMPIYSIPGYLTNH